MCQSTARTFSPPFIRFGDIDSVLMMLPSSVRQFSFGAWSCDYCELFICLQKETTRSCVGPVLDHSIPIVNKVPCPLGSKDPDSRVIQVTRTSDASKIPWSSFRQAYTSHFKVKLLRPDLKKLFFSVIASLPVTLVSAFLDGLM
jgi:hypothetical protein